MRGPPTVAEVASHGRPTPSRHPPTLRTINYHQLNSISEQRKLAGGHAARCRCGPGLSRAQVLLVSSTRPRQNPASESDHPRGRWRSGGLGRGRAAAGTGNLRYRTVPVPYFRADTARGSLAPRGDLSIANGCSLDPVEALAGDLRRAWHGKGGRQGWRTQSARLNRMFLAHVDAEMVSGISGPRIGCASWRASTTAGSAVQKAPPSRDTPASLGLRGTAGPSCGWTWFGGADDGLRQPEP